MLCVHNKLIKHYISRLLLFITLANISEFSSELMHMYKFPGGRIVIAVPQINFPIQSSNYQLIALIWQWQTDGKSEGRYFNNLKLSGGFPKSLRYPKVPAFCMFCVTAELPRWFGVGGVIGKSQAFLCDLIFSVGRGENTKTNYIPHAVGDNIRASEVCLDNHYRWMEALSSLGRRKQGRQDVCYWEWKSG